ncbi:MAG: ribonuclease H-like domain-containing protein [Ignavibacteriae bacterium]|nr:ribonuclease H-like domain-containing protein [Ignavibacteriota bacterium]
MNRVVFDIETLGYPLDSFDEKQQEYLLKFSKTDEERIEAIQKLALTPLTGHIIAIGMLNPDSHHGKVWFAPEAQESFCSDDGMIEFVSASEKDMLEQFWQAVAHFEQFITFNGRSFDCPFIMLRSAVLGVTPTRNLIPYRYSHVEHCDLLEQLTFYNAFRKFNLDFYCKSFGIKSPKSEGITGLDLGPLYDAGHFREIAEYCIGDVKATAELFFRWQSYLAFEK